MSNRDRIDADSLAALDALLGITGPGGFNAIADLGERRAFLDQMLAAMTADLPPNERVTSEDRTIPGPAGAPDIPIRVYRPTAVEGVLPGIVVFHGGGMVLGDIASEDLVCQMLTEAVGAVCVSVEYRLAPETPVPGPAEDCYAALSWTVDHAAELRLDPDRVAIFGRSAGGGLVAAVSLMARDRGGPPIAFQMPIYPMIDDRNTTASSQEIVDVGIWDRPANLEAWAWYLGDRHGTDRVTAYDAPARATDLSGLPPTFIDVGTVDLFRDEDVAYAASLLQAGVPTELHVWPGAFHASETFAPDAALSQRIWAARLDALRRALGTQPSN